MNKKTAHIGLFDSGVGGLFVFRAIAKHPQLRKYNLAYLGDTKNMPYGARTPDDVYTLTVAGVERLFREGAHIVVLACNTASALALRRIQQEWLPKYYPRRRVLGVVIPTIEAAVDAHDTDVLVLGTVGTVTSHVYKREIEKLRARISVTEVAVPYAAQLIEAGQKEYACALLAHAIMRSGMKKGAVLLGCTHYEEVARELRSMFPNIHIVAQGAMVARKLAQYLERHGDMRAYLQKSGRRSIVFTKSIPKHARKDGILRFVGETT